MPAESGDFIPIFIINPSLTHVIDSLNILEIIHNYLEDKDIYLVEFKVKPGNRILVFLDGDQGVNIDDCAGLNRFLESKLDRSVEDFEIEVSSAGADAPIRLRRQYYRHIGRQFRFTLTDGSQLTGTLLKIVENDLTLSCMETTQLPSGKTIRKNASEKVIQFDQIKEARIELSFK